MCTLLHWDTAGRNSLTYPVISYWTGWAKKYQCEESPPPEIFIHCIKLHNLSHFNSSTLIRKDLEMTIGQGQLSLYGSCEDQNIFFHSVNILALI